MADTWRGLFGGEQNKIFGIGRNKTGTTSLQQALAELGYRVAPTRMGELLLDDWIEGNYEPVRRLCRKYDAFQDIPFSIPRSHEVLDELFPSSKFILTTRDSDDQWFDSLLRFHSKVFGNGSIPTWQQLEESEYCSQGFIAKCQRVIYQADEFGLYNAKHYKTVYQEQNQLVRDYFSDRPGDFLELNISEDGAFESLCSFLKIESPAISRFPWANKT